MAFNSFRFLIFFPIVTILYYAIPKKLKPVWLLFASYFFYMSWNPKYAILILISTVITYLSGILLSKNENGSLRKWIVFGSFFVNLSILFFFKYCNFMLDNINAVLRIFNGQNVTNPFSFILPVGISFYTFQALGYTVDVYRKKTEAEKNFINYALFVSFFPQLVAGPIERSTNLLLQIKKVTKEKMFDYEKFVKGFTLMCYGMFMKVVIADRISIFVDGVYSSLQNAGLVETMAAAAAFSIQIYCDFGGYSLIAIGAANVMGFDLCENFNAPYFADSISDFWHRWHISLSTWFKDYLYIPLGGSRCSKIRKYFNILVTFLVSGLWHGADWTYVFWGGLHGVFQIVGDILKPVKEKVNGLLKTDTSVFSYRFGRIAVTFILTSLAWVPFRASNFSDVTLFFKDMFTRPDFWVLTDGSIFNYGLSRPEATILFISLLILLVFDIIKYKMNMTIGDFLYKQNLWFRWAVLILIIVSCLIFGEYGMNFDSTQFIYFRF
ncbi:MAG: MBOAT family protein [Lachnospiraceae bacterium]|nr:MBOAT family protein [Lachnospiraceae bacterium]